MLCGDRALLRECSGASAVTLPRDGHFATSSTGDLAAMHQAPPRTRAARQRPDLVRFGSYHGSDTEILIRSGAGSIDRTAAWSWMWEPTSARPASRLPSRVMTSSPSNPSQAHSSYFAPTSNATISGPTRCTSLNRHPRTSSASPERRSAPWWVYVSRLAVRPRSCVARGCLDFDVWSVQIGSVPLRRDAVVELGFDESLPMIEDWGLYVRKKHRPTTSRVTTPSRTESRCTGWARWRAHSVQARVALAVDGHASGQEAAAKPLEERRPTLEGLGVNPMKDARLA